MTSFVSFLKFLLKDYSYDIIIAILFYFYFYLHTVLLSTFHFHFICVFTGEIFGSSMKVYVGLDLYPFTHFPFLLDNLIHLHSSVTDTQYGLTAAICVQCLSLTPQVYSSSALMLSAFF